MDLDVPSFQNVPLSADREFILALPYKVDILASVLEGLGLRPGESMGHVRSQFLALDNFLEQDLFFPDIL